jgi:aspartate/methionine/tyrosine aminotransferase
MRYRRMPIEIESPEELGYGNIRCNLSESSITDVSLAALGLTTLPNLTLLYGEHRGGAALRALIAAQGAGISASDVLICSGSAGALFIVATALLAPGDVLVVVRPNYATNLETPRAIGCEVRYIDLKFEDSFRLDLNQVRRALSGDVRMISVTSPHNPTGTVLSDAELRQLAELAREHDCRLLVDETYRDLALDARPLMAATLGPQVISVSSLSKAFGAPGLRLGWIVNSDARLMETFLAAREQMSICGSVIDEWVAGQILSQRDGLMRATLAEMRWRRDLLDAWVAGEPLVEWVRPAGGVVGLPRVREEPVGGMEGFYERLLRHYGTYVGRGRWFEMPDRYFRIGYGWPSRGELEQGLTGISKALRT